MNNKYLYVTDRDWFEGTSLADPIIFPDHKLEGIYPKLYSADYDLKILVTKKASEAEKSSPLYNDYSEKYGCDDITVLKEAVGKKIPRNVFLNGFRQEHLEYLAPLIKDSAEILYLFKCPSVKNLSALGDFKKLRCLFIFHNNSLESLWNMQDNTALTVLSFVHVTKLRKIDSLKESKVEYITFDSMDNSGCKKDFLIGDPHIFDELTELKHLKLVYKNLKVDR